MTVSFIGLSLPRNTTIVWGKICGGIMLNPFVHLVSNLIYLYNIVLVVWIILNWLISFNIVNRHQPLVYRVSDILNRLTEPVLRPIRRYMPNLGAIDISPIVLILLLNFLNDAMYQYFYTR